MATAQTRGLYKIAPLRTTRGGVKARLVEKAQGSPQADRTGHKVLIESCILRLAKLLRDGVKQHAGVNSELRARTPFL